MNGFSPAELTLEKLRARGEPQLFERDPDVIRDLLVAWFEEETNRVLYPDQTEMFLIEMLAYALSLQAEASQAANIANLAVFAAGRHLEDVAANISVRKLPATAATLRMRFQLPAPAKAAVLIPRGTLAGAGDLQFATVDDVLIAAGQSAGEADAAAIGTGAGHNGLIAGQVTAQLTSIATGLSGANITTSTGGAEEETDEHLRTVVIDAAERFDRRGGWGGYGLEVRRVNPAIAEVAVHRPEPGHIHIYPLLTDAVVPGQTLLDQVATHLRPEDVSPHGDYVSVLAPAAVDFDFTLRCHLDPDADWARIEEEVRGKVDAAFAAMRRPAGAGSDATQFAPETGALGAQIAPSAVTAAAREVAGVIDAEAIGLVWQDLPFNQFARVGVLIFDPLSAADA